MMGTQSQRVHHGHQLLAPIPGRAPTLFVSLLPPHDNVLSIVHACMLVHAYAPWPPAPRCLPRPYTHRAPPWPAEQSAPRAGCAVFVPQQNFDHDSSGFFLSFSNAGAGCVRRLSPASCVNEPICPTTCPSARVLTQFTRILSWFEFISNFPTCCEIQILPSSSRTTGRPWGRARRS